jgi:chemotaxis protein methyltransferase CheR
MGPLELSPQVFAILSSLIEERTGLHYGLMDRELLADKAGTRAQDAGFESLLDYYYFLRYDPGGEQEFAALVESLVVNETYFFREYPPLEVLVREVLQPKAAAGGRVRVWSAACSTGEEPLTLAMMLDAAGLLDRVELVASDISPRVLARAQGGLFGRRAVRQLPAPALAQRYLQQEGEGWRVERRLVDAVHWRQVNLTEPAQVAALGTFDAVVCRNVLIYFRDETVRQVVGRLGERLGPGGVLLVGVSESLLRFSTEFVGEEHRGAFLYRKAGGTAGGKAGGP